MLVYCCMATALQHMIGTVCHNFVSSSLLITHLGLGNSIDLATTFKVFALVNGIRGPIGHLTWFVPHFNRFEKKMRQIQKFLELKEVPEECLVDQIQDSEHTISIDKNSFSWGCKLEKDEDSDEEGEKKEKEKTEEYQAQSLQKIITLKDIDFKVKKGDLVFVIGDVGSGKSSLLSALTGDLLYVDPK